MDRGLLQEAIKLNKEHKRKKRWNRIVCVLASIVVFCTTYALILPAITLEKKPICGFDEHVHCKTCYEGQTLSGNMLTLSGNGVSLSGNSVSLSGNNLRCTFEEHVHDDSCYPLEKKPEIIKAVKKQSSSIMTAAETATVDINITCWTHSCFTYTLPHNRPSLLTTEPNQ